MSEYVRGLRDAMEIAERQRSKFHARDWDDAITAVMEQIEDWAQESDEYAASGTLTVDTAGSRRGKYAGVGDRYDAETDEFVSPVTDAPAE